MIIAITPSLNAARRSLPMTPPCLFKQRVIIRASNQILQWAPRVAATARHLGRYEITAAWAASAIFTAIRRALPWGSEKAAGVAWGIVAKGHARCVSTVPSWCHALWLIRMLWAI